MKVVVLAGGSGTRLWPFSRQSFPKQFLHFGDGVSLLQKTLLRLNQLAPPEDLVIVANPEYAHLVAIQASAIDSRYADQILVEPERRNTAPAIALAMKYLQEVKGVSNEECVLIAASDHLISPVDVFVEKVHGAIKWGLQGYHLLFGIHPSKPDTGYGYVRGVPVQKEDVWKVEAFVEKPNLAMAQSYVESGKYLWNAGFFLFQMGAFWEDWETCCLDMGSWRNVSFEEMTSRFGEMPAQSIDYALMERSDRIMMLPLNVNWSDMGSWDSVYAVLDKDTHANVKMGNVHDVDTKNCLIIGGKRLISTVGIEDMLIVETEDALFIGKKGGSEQVKRLVEELKLHAHSTV